MNRADQGQLAAEIGMGRPADPAQDELDSRFGFDLVAYAKRKLWIPVPPMIFPGGNS